MVWPRGERNDEGTWRVGRECSIFPGSDATGNTMRLSVIGTLKFRTRRVEVELRYDRVYSCEPKHASPAGLRSLGLGSSIPMCILLWHFLDTYNCWIAFGGIAYTAMHCDTVILFGYLVGVGGCSKEEPQECTTPTASRIGTVITHNLRPTNIIRCETWYPVATKRRAMTGGSTLQTKHFLLTGHLDWRTP